MDAPWWVSGCLALLAFISVRWLIPASTAHSIILGGVVQGLSPIGYVVAAFFGFVAVANFLRQRFRALDSIRLTSTRGQYVEPTLSQNRFEPDRVFEVWESSTAIPEASPVKPTAWSVDLLRLIEWKRFELLAVAFYREIGLRAETIQYGADGGIDAKLFRERESEPTSIVQCKAWNTRPVGVKPVRELLGVMTHEKVPEGIFMTTGDFSSEATAFARTNPIELVNGAAFLEMIHKLTEDAQKRLLAIATEGDFTTPTCPSCGIKMMRRNSKKVSFWGCRNYPRCKSKFFMKGDGT